jgi:two-component sensor histidine kinase
MAARRVGNDGEKGAAQAEQAARSSWSRCEAALIDSRITVAASDRDGRYVWLFNPPGELPSTLVGKLDADLLDLAAAGKLAEAKRTVIESETPTQFELELSGERGPRWFNVGVRPHYDRGELVGTVASFIDVTESKVQEEHLRIVLRELAHRSKNLLSVIQGIARQTAETASSTQQFLSRFNGRLFSLSRAHDILTDADWRGARIFDLVQSQIALFAAERLASVVVEGENGFLRPNAAQYVGLALHELATNAIKYGALSRDDGTILVRFERSANSPLVYCFSWRETSSAEIREPSGQSFGLLMLKDVVPASVGGASELSFRPEGLQYDLEIPKAQLIL